MNNKIPIGIAIPIQKGNAHYFDQTYDTLTQVRSNIINLLSTRPGERRMQPNFGSRLWDLAFEQNIELVHEIAKKIIEEDITTWVPGVSIVNTDISFLKNDGTVDDRDIYRLHITVQFIVNSTKQLGTIEMNVDNN